MNKIIMTIGVASSLLTTPTEKDGTEVYHSTQLVYAMNNIEDMKEWLVQDIENNKINSEEIDYINAHGTSTLIGDDIELNAIMRFLNNNQKIKISSTKSRLSLVFFTGPRDDALVETLSINGTSHYAPVLVKDHLDEKIKATNI